MAYAIEHEPSAISAYRMPAYGIADTTVDKQPNDAERRKFSLVLTTLTFFTTISPKPAHEADPLGGIY